MSMSVILIVDDEPANFDVLERFLSDHYILHYASSGLEAMETLELMKVDLILLDVMMPGVDGFDVCTRIKENSAWRMIPILMITALTAKEDLAKGIAVGADDFISKPVNSLELRARVTSLLRIKRYQDELSQYHAQELAFELERNKLIQARADELELMVRQRTASLDEAIKVLEHTSFHDPLTDLPNRSMLLRNIQSVIEANHHDPSTRYAILFLDIDLFSEINDLVGHVLGDQILIEISKRLLAVLGSGCTVARFGGDEFVILLTDVKENAEILDLATKLNRALAEPINLEGRDFSLTASIGIVYGSERYQEANQLLGDADLAMYDAKRSGGDCAGVFDEKIRQRLLRNYDLLKELRQALDRGDFVPYFQPIIDLNTSRCVGFEALARWQHPQKGIIPPSDFIPLAEANGLIGLLTHQILQRACQQLAMWRRRFPAARPLKISMNITADDLASPCLLEVFQESIASAQLDASSITVELTESGFIENYDVANATAERLRSNGFDIAIDDFGTGYSSLSYLSKMPISIIKIDQSFVSKMHQDDRTYGIVDSIIALAKRMGLKVVAEGLETSAQLILLKSLGCDFGQGYLISKPMPAEYIEATFLDVSIPWSLPLY